MQSTLDYCVLLFYDKQEMHRSYPQLLWRIDYNKNRNRVPLYDAHQIRSNWGSLLLIQLNVCVFFIKILQFQDIKKPFTAPAQYIK